MAHSSVRRILTAIPRGVLLGVGTLFQPKAKADDHWSVSPTVRVVEEAADHGSGAPPDPDPDPGPDPCGPGRDLPRRHRLTGFSGEMFNP